MNRDLVTAHAAGVVAVTFWVLLIATSNMAWAAAAFIANMVQIVLLNRATERAFLR